MSSTLLRFAACLAAPETREAGARGLADAFGAAAFLLFIHDPEVGALLPAPGFPQTLPTGKLWPEFLAATVERGRHEGTLPLRYAGERLPAVGYAQGCDIAFALVGTKTPAIDAEWLRELLPMLAAVFRGEQQAAVEKAQAGEAREATPRAATLATTLDRTRRQLEDALVVAKDARSELEEVHAQLREHAANLELANAQLRRQAAALEEQAAQLEAQRDELAAANAELQEARDVAEAASRAKTDFLATMSHELRTPLNAIAGYVQLLELEVHGPVTEAQRSVLARIDRSQRHLLGLINDILNLSRIEAGRIDYVLSDVPLSDALADVQPMVEPQIAAKSLSFEVRDAERMPVVRADREKLEQILVNLLSNAAKFTDRGGRVWIDTRERAEVPGKVFLRVADTGHGIPADKVDMIFEPFTQVDASHSRSGQGIGLGLTISRDLARGMGGDLRVRSEPGKGSVFTLTLDRAES